MTPAAAVPKKKLVRRQSIDRSQLLRLVFQWVFLLLNVWIAVEFYLFVRFYETGGQSVFVPRPPGVEGWLPRSAVSSDRKIVLSDSATAKGVRATEQSAGGRGFNPQVEGRYKASRADLQEAYRIVDRLQNMKYSEDLVGRFVREGKLGDQAVAEAPAAAAPAKAQDRQTPPWKR